MEQVSSIATEKRPGGYKVTFRKIARAAAAEIRVHKKIAIITYVLYGVAMLLFIFNSVQPPYHYGGEAEFTSSGWGAFFAILGALVGFPAVLNVFRDTNNQQLCDVSMALPIKAVERFFSKLICLFAVQIAPLILSVLGGNALGILLGTIRYSKLEQAEPNILFTLFFAFLAGELFIMAITVLCACCCGAPAESSYFSIIMMFIINTLPIIFVNNILSGSAGFSSSAWIFNNWDNGIDVCYWGFLYFFGFDLDFLISHAAVGCGISICVMLSAVFIYKKRDARSVGTPIASKVFFEIVMAAGCVTILALGAMTSWLMWTVLIAAVSYLIINIIVSRAKIKFTSVLKWVGKFAVTAAAFLGLLVVCVKTGGFGYCKARPEKMFLTGAEFTIRLTDNYDYWYYDYYYAPSENTTKRLYTNALTPDQADEVMNIVKKHISKGLVEINPFDVIFDRGGNAWISIYAESDAVFDVRPKPRSQFNEMYDFNFAGGSRLKGYHLDYEQALSISVSEKIALYNELEQLDFVFDDEEKQYDTELA